MQARTICLRCPQKCHFIAEVIDGKLVALVDATPANRTPPCREVCPIGMDVSPWDTLKDYLNWMLKYQGLTYDELLQKPIATLTFPRKYERYPDSIPPFSTPTGKVELYSTIFEAVGLDAMPVFEEPPESPLRTPGLFKKSPFIYTHYRIHGYMHNEGRQIKGQLAPEPFLQISSEKAAAPGIVDGDWVYLETPKSEGKWLRKYRAKLVPEMRPDVVAGPQAWWFPPPLHPLPPRRGKMDRRLCLSNYGLLSRSVRTPNSHLPFLQR